MDKILAFFRSLGIFVEAGKDQMGDERRRVQHPARRGRPRLVGQRRQRAGRNLPAAPARAARHLPSLVGRTRRRLRSWRQSELPGCLLLGRCSALRAARRRPNYRRLLELGARRARPPSLACRAAVCPPARRSPSSPRQCCGRGPVGGRCGSRRARRAARRRPAIAARRVWMVSRPSTVLGSSSGRSPSYSLLAVVPRPAGDRGSIGGRSSIPTSIGRRRAWRGVRWRPICCSSRPGGRSSP